MPRQDKKIIIGVTGGFGTGKTSVSRALKRFGAFIVDADKIAHELIQPHGAAWKKVVKTFGPGILDKNNGIDRAKLARIVFNSKQKLRKLNEIIHPKVISRIKKEINSSPCRVVVLDAPLLLEAGLKGMVCKLIVVKCSRKKQIERLKQKRGFNNKQIRARISVQAPISGKVRLADFVIDNNGTQRETEKQLKKIWDKLSLPTGRQGGRSGKVRYS
ncbi:MAG: dephospho-CoA kinase [Candidatus Omnitrophica bacterium]|nr:dephospho-CoA kinase [Candidatus Omnitrophota bacterium]